MANVPPAPIPHGYTLQSSTPPTFEFFQPNMNKETEIDFNQFLYMTVPRGGSIDGYEEVASETLQAIVRTPEIGWEEKMKDMIMVNEEGNHTPAYLPHFGDVLGKMKLPNVFRRLEKSNNEYDGISKVIPNVLKKLVDPKPQLKFEGPIYPLANTPVDILMGHYTDALVVFRIVRPLSEIDMVVTRGYNKKPFVDFVRFNGLRISPKVEEGEHQLAAGWTVVVWNVRHAGRPSFKENFARIMQIHNPVAVMLTETRVYKAGFTRVDDKLDIEMGWGIDESIGLGGGSTLMWDKNRAKGETLVAGMDSQEIRMIASLKPLGAPDDPSSPDSPNDPEDFPCTCDDLSPEI